MNEKPVLRDAVRAEIEALPDDYMAESDRGIFVNLMSLREFQDAGTIFVYHSVGREPDTVGIAKFAFELGKTVAFPYCYRGGIMDARAVHSLDDLIPAMLGIPAPPPDARLVPPDALDLVIVPALAYDRDGYRLGYGGGYYDRYLSGIRAFTAGITRQRLLRDVLPREAHDIAVKCLITEKNTARL